MRKTMVMTTSSSSTGRFRALLALLLGAAVAAVLVLALVMAVGAKPAQAAFPGEDGKIAFSSNRTTGTGVNNPTGDFEIFTMSPTGTELTQLTNNETADFAPAWSYGGKKIAFERHITGTDGDIFVMDAVDADADNNGDNQKNLTKSAADEERPAWSPDGKKIAYERQVDGLSDEVFVMNSDGSKQTNLTNSARFDGTPAFSPNGTKIAFMSERDGDSDIFTMNPDGTGLSNLTNSNTQSDSTPDWSPDGTEIVYGRFQAFAKIGVNPDGSAAGTPTSLPAGPGPFSVDAAFSPDGQQVVYANRLTSAGANDIFTMDAEDANGDGSADNRNNLTNNAANDVQPDWQPIDTTGPAGLTFTPPNGTGGVAPTISPTVTFSENMNPDTLNKKTVQLLREAAPGKLKKVRATLTYDPVTRTLTIDPKKDLKPGFTYTIRVLGGDKGVKDLAGNAAPFVDSSSGFTVP